MLVVGAFPFFDAVSALGVAEQIAARAVFVCVASLAF
jgi:hypothetical protein